MSPLNSQTNAQQPINKDSPLNNVNNVVNQVVSQRQYLLSNGTSTSDFYEFHLDTMKAISSHNDENEEKILSISIKPFQNSYQDQIIDLIVNIQRNEFNIDITATQQPDLNDIAFFYQTGKGNFWIALEQDRVIGTIALLDIGHDKAALRKMFVHEAYRGKEKKIAKSLLDALLAWSENHQLQEIYLGTTPAFLAAHRFYEKNGFSEIHQNQLPKSFPIMSVDKKFYRYIVK